MMSEEIARKVVNRMGQGRVENGEYIKDGAAETYVGIVMPNKIWKLTWSPLFMSSVSPRPEPSSHLLSPGRRMSSVLPDLDRMLPVLERMTKNLMYEATTGHVVRKKKNFMGRERKRNVPGK